MKNIFLILLIAFGAHGAQGQSQPVLQLKDAENLAAVTGAHIWCISESDSLLLMSDAEGQAVLPDWPLPYQLRVSHVAFRPLAFRLRKSEPLYLRYLLPEATELQEAVVTGLAQPTEAREAQRIVRVIDRERIEQQAAVNLRDLLTNDLNFRVSEDAILGSQLSLQGLSGAKVKILIDGVPVIGRLDGNIDLSQINLQDIERVEIIEGPMSVQYGTDAVAGTINLITKKATAATWQTDLNAYYENVGRYNSSLTSQWTTTDQLRLKLQVGANLFDGFDPRGEVRNLQWSPKDQYFASLGGQKKLGENTLLRYRGEYFWETISNRGAVGSFDSALVAADTGAWKYPRALDDRYRTQRHNHSLFLQHFFPQGGKLQLFGAYNGFTRTKNTRIKNLSTGADQLFTGADAQDTTQISLWSSRGFYHRVWQAGTWSSQIGYDASHEHFQGARIRNGAQRLTELALFAKAQYTPTEELSLEPGLRYAYNSRFEAPLIFSLAARWQMHPQWIMRASYGQGFRAPSLKELFFFFVDVNHNILGNPDLQAERSDNYQLSLSHEKESTNGSYAVEASGFFNDINNEIRLVAVIAPDDNDPRGLFRNANIARTQTTGGSLRLKGQWRQWEAEAGTSLIGMKNELAFSESAATENSRFYFYPQYRVNLSYHWQKLQLRPSLFFNHIGERQDLSTTPEGEIGVTTFQNYSVADFTLQKTFGRQQQLTLTTGIKNIMDVTQLQADQQIGGGAHSQGSRSVPFSYGRSYFVQLQYQFKP